MSRDATPYGTANGEPFCPDCGHTADHRPGDCEEEETRGPQRIQLRRTKGWRKPEGAIVVARPSRWGNPFRIVDDEIIVDDRGNDWMTTNPRQAAVDLYRDWLDNPARYAISAERTAILANLDELAGHDLACWCPLDQPCHADVLLELANP